MRRCLILRVVGASLILIGCAATPTPDPWQQFEVTDEAASRPADLGAWPEPIEITETEVTFDLDGAIALERYRVAGEGNTEIAAAHARQIDAMRDTTRHLIEAGQAQWRVAELRRTILEEERRAWLIEKFSLYAGIGLLLVGIAL